MLLHLHREWVDIERFLLQTLERCKKKKKKVEHVYIYPHLLPYMAIVLFIRVFSFVLLNTLRNSFQLLEIPG